LNSKADVRELDRLAALVLKKPDADKVTEVQHAVTTEVSDLLNSFKTEIKYDHHKLQDLIYEKVQSTESKIAIVEEEGLATRDQLQGLINESRSDLEEISTHIQSFVSTVKTDSKTELNEIRLEL
jgi:hypothetical protein